jgi:putative ATP-binding cassette transporter
MIKCILFLWRYSPGRVAAAMALTILSGFSGVALLALANIVLQGRAISREVIIWSFVGLCLLLPLSRFASEILISRLAQRAVFDLQVRLPKKIAGAPLRFLEDHGTHRLLAVLIQDMQVFGSALLFVPVTCLNLAIIASGLVYLGWLSRMVCVVALGFIVLCYVIYRFPASKAAKSLRMARQATDGLYYHFRSLMGGAKELKLHQRRRRAFFSQVLHSSASSIRSHNVSGLTASSAAAAWAQISGFVLIGTLLLAIPLFKLDAQARIGYTMALIFMMAPLQVLLSRVSDFKLAQIALQNIEDLERKLTTVHAELDAPIENEFNRELKRLDLVDITHVYQREGEIHGFTVGPMSLSLVPGEVVFLVGGNGSGKTTLAKLLVGLYAPENGQVYLNGQVITDSNREQYRQYFSVVFADFHLFDRLLGLEEFRLDENATSYLIQLELDHEVVIKNGCLSTTKLSQGQRKRLALLTAFMENRPIYVFDEWAADQDPSFKKTFYHTFLPELRAKGKAVVVISHDDRYYDVADRIIRMDCGTIVELPHAGQIAQTA